MTAARRCFPSLCFLLLATLPVTHAAGADGTSGRPPNVLVILADDMGYSDAGCYGGEIATPNIDALAEGGIRFTQFYNTGRCWPSRAALLSGYYAQQVNRDPPGARPKWAVLVPDLLRRTGYRTYHSGKWHVDGPVLAGGFDRSYELVDPDRDFGPKEHRLDDRPLPPPRPEERYYGTTAIAEHALGWLDEHEAGHAEKPFFLYLAFMAPHFPLMAPEADIARYRGRYDEGWDAIRGRRLKRQRELGIYGGELSRRDPRSVPGWNLKEDELRARIGPGEVGRALAWDELTPEQKAFQSAKMAIHAAMVDRMDREIGRVVERLRKSGKLDTTLILFASDNGASAEQIIRGDGHDRSASPGSARSFLCLGPGWSTAANTPFRLHKSWNHEGGIATPLIVHWPAGIRDRGEIRHAPGHFIDIVPTILALAGVAAPDEWGGERRPPLPGRSLVPAFTKDAPIGREFLFFKHAGNRALRLGDWKIVAAGPGSPWELYDLSRDRAETTDLAAREPSRVAELSAIWSRADAEYDRQGTTGKPLQKPARGEPAKGASR
ncbi:Arylsulfatase [Aquisphaera giovannonii]|uniref:Arylsulfatase n=1 Tax=Aquisphaera giovannonii TaxID=406548 RepID=A0A5B9WBY6_9BACT|nr:arylsulfatase [Aquisphaera giovannonii]QEH38027.1 Arylsulfatase [Aquisphaera giovannonii]